MKNLSDQIYIEQLRQRLWINRGTGRAAVMVGAGFSRNGDSLLPTTPSFPLWKELVRAMVTDLYPSAVDSNANKDPLRLATEYESVFGRDALNSLIVRAIPDADYKPGRLHQILLSLPWADVFTTNYDTLLERTLPDIHDRKYNIVLTPSDLTARVKPRIVKLHGSFPSHLPFIITQEDFRTYPREFAPFVNTVQQSIIENAFCLLGFSGEDPNFLNWTGWVRDNLGNLSPPIYFCSLFEISPSERRVLEKRSIFPIDLSAVIEKSVIPDDNLRSAKTLEWFLLELWNGAPLNNLNYPRLERQNRWKASHDVPPPSETGARENDLGDISPSGINREFSTDELRDILKRWRAQRETYPGWLVLPADNRERLWRYTEQWINPVLHSLNNLTAPENLSLLYELNWRLERCLLPIPDEGAAEKYRQILFRFNPFPTLLSRKAELQPDNDVGRNFEWSEISHEWTELTFALMRRAREQFEDAEFRQYVQNLQDIIKQNRDWRARWFYERCLFTLFRFDQEEARKILIEWDKSLGDSFWQVKRAAVLAELGQIEQAEEQSEAALANIRSRQNPFSDNYALFSQEGWALLLLKGIKDNRIFTRDKSAGEYRDRCEQLAIYRSNPWIDLENFELKVKNLDPRPKPTKKTVKGFSPGEETVSYSLLSSNEPEKARLALSFLRLFEEAGVPFRLNRMMNFSEAVTNAAFCLAGSDLEQTLSTLIRIEKTDDIDMWFHRHHIANLSESSVNRFFVLFSSSFVGAIQRYQQSLGSGAGEETALRRIKLFAELISRLCHRLSPEQFETVFTYAEQIYKHPVFTHNAWLHATVTTLFKRILEAMPPSGVLSRMNRLLELPVPTEGGFEVAEMQMWIEPFERIRWTKRFKLPEGFDRSAWSRAVENLLRIVRSGAREARERGVTRLAALHQIKALTTEETAEFERAVWSRTDPQTHLPIETNIEKWELIHLPNPNMEETKNLLRRYLATQDFPRVVRCHTDVSGRESSSVGIGTGANSLVENIINLTLQSYSTPEEREKLIDWSAEETKIFLDKAVASWDDQKSYLSRFTDNFEMAGDNLRQQFMQLADLFALVSLPRLADADAATKDTVKRVLGEMDAKNVFPLSALPTKLFVAPEEVNEIFSKMLTGLRSVDAETVRDAAHGTRNWLFYTRNGGLVEFPERLFDELVSVAILRRQPGLLPVIKILAWAAEIMPEVFNDNHFADIIMTLEFLRTEAFSSSFYESDESQNIGENEHLAIQDACQQLAKAIKQFYENTGKPLPKTIDFWVNRD